MYLYLLQIVAALANSIFTAVYVGDLFDRMQVIGGIRIYPYAQAEHMWKTLRVTADPLTFDRRCTILQVLAHGPDGNPCTILAPAYTGRDLDQGLKTINEVVKFEVSPRCFALS